MADSADRSVGSVAARETPTLPPDVAVGASEGRFGHPEVGQGRSEALRAEFVRLLTEDGPTTDRRRRDYNQAIFSPDGWAVWSATTLDMVMAKFDRAAKSVSS